MVNNFIQSLTTTQIVAIAVLVVAFITVAYNYFRQKQLDQIRADVYKLFLEVEHKYIGSDSGKQKLDDVVEAAHLLLPPWLRIFITKAVLRGIIDEWFRTIKDLLDDGKANNSV